MKKFLLIVSIFLLSFLFVACKSKSDFEKVFEEKLITFSGGENKDTVKSDITLATTSKVIAGATITWESSNDSVIKIEGNNGFVTRSSEGDITVTLKAKVKIGQITQFIEFKLKVIKSDGTVQKYTVSFNSNGGSNVDSQSVDKNSLASAPTIPTKEGFEFVGWFDETLNNEFNFSTPITSNITLYAKWASEGEEVVKELYKFDFATTTLGTSYSGNQNAEKDVTNVLDNSTVKVVVTRAAANNNHGTYKDYFLIFSASDKNSTNDFAFIEFNFNEEIKSVKFEATYWSQYDADQTTKFVLEVFNGTEWTQVHDVKADLNGSLSYVNVNIQNLSGSKFRLYAEGTDPTGTGSNGARILIDNIIFTGVAGTAGEDKTAPIINGAKNLQLKTNSTAPNWLAGITATDNKDGNVAVTIEENTVVLTSEGTYRIVYKAVDAAGNVATVTIEVVVSDELAQQQKEVYKFDFKNSTLGYSYSSNQNAEKEITNILDNSKVKVVSTRATENTNHGTYTDNFLVLSASNTSTTNDFAFLEFHFNEVVNAMKFEAVYWSQYDADQTTKLVLEVLEGTTWKQVYDVKAALDGSLTYKEVNVSGLNGKTFRLYAEGTDPTGTGSNGARVLFDNMICYSGTGVVTPGEDKTAPVITGHRNLTLYLNSTTPDYLNGVSATDNVDGNVEVKIIYNDVDLTNKGTYTIKFEAVDKAGNKTTVNVIVTVTESGVYAGYYATLNGLSSSQIKAELTRIISNMTSISYTNTSYVLEDADVSPDNPGKLLLIYDRKLVANKWDGASTWNKEHIWPQSKLGTASKSDLHNLRASTPSVNSSRGNDAFVDGSGSYGRKTGGWYPGDADKGDVARIVLYMNTRWGLTISTSVIGNLEMFVRWHNEDPVDQFEIKRNEEIFKTQKNRNPYVDHPELVDVVYGTAKTSSNKIIYGANKYYFDFKLFEKNSLVA